METRRVLLVEDEVLIRLIAEEFLQESGFEVVEAWNGDEAAKLLDGPDHFDVLFTDVRMPGNLDGIALAEHARQRRPMIPVLVVSGYADNLSSRLRKLTPPVVLIGKPYDLTAIAEALGRLIAER